MNERESTTYNNNEELSQHIHPFMHATTKHDISYQGFQEYIANTRSLYTEWHSLVNGKFPDYDAYVQSNDIATRTRIENETGIVIDISNHELNPAATVPAGTSFELLVPTTADPQVLSVFAASLELARSEIQTQYEEG